MRYFKLAYDIIVNKFLFNLLIIVEIAAMLLLTNTVVATYNSKEMLYEPYRELLSDDGVVLMLDNQEELEMNDDEVVQNILERHNGVVEYSELFDLFKENLKGNTKIVYAGTTALINGEGGLVSGMEGDINHTVSCYYLDHSIFEKLRMPLAAGRWASSEKNGNGEIEIVISAGTNALLNKVYDTRLGKLKVVGILTNNTYIPPVDFQNTVKDKMSIFDFYDSFDSNISMRAPFALIDQQLFGENQLIFAGSTIFVSYGKGLSKEEIQTNNEYLQKFGYIRDQYGEENFQTIADQSEKYLNDIYIHMLPIVLSAAVVVLAGLIGSIAISTVRQKKHFGIFFLCGCRWKDCTKIILAYLTILFAMAAALTILGIIVMKILNMDYLIGSVYSFNNLLVSIFEIVVMYLLAIILPHSIIKNSSPVETIKEN